MYIYFIDIFYFLNFIGMTTMERVLMQYAYTRKKMVNNLEHTLNFN